MKKLITLTLILTLVLTMFAGCNKPQEYVGVDMKIGALIGPTGMGMSKLMKDSENKTTANNYSFELFSAHKVMAI